MAMPIHRVLRNMGLAQAEQSSSAPPEQSEWSDIKRLYDVTESQSLAISNLAAELANMTKDVNAKLDSLLNVLTSAISPGTYGFGHLPVTSDVPIIILNKQTGLAVGAPAEAETERRIYQTRPDSERNHRWFLRREPGGAVILSCGGLNNNVLSVEDGSVEDAYLRVDEFENQDSQKFYFESLDDGSYVIKPKHTVGANFVLDSMSDQEGGLIHQHPWHGRDNQRWLLRLCFGS